MGGLFQNSLFFTQNYNHLLNKVFMQYTNVQFYNTIQEVSKSGIDKKGIGFDKKGNDNGSWCWF
jgi:hypothetical protein